MSEVVTKHYVVVAPLTFTGVGGVFTYHSDAPLATGKVVKVPLGRRQSLGVVIAGTNETPKFATKAVDEVLDIAALPTHIVELALWMADYYYASPKSVWQTILPAGISKKRRAAKKPPKAFALPKPEHELTAEQQAALATIRADKYRTHLIQGVTGSGKTRIYIELAAESLAAGRSAIVLIPEIALTPQLIAVFEASFPGRVVPFHSGLTEAQKHNAWSRAHESEEPLVVVGPRSALFLPLRSIGLIVIDECHETTYKQEQNPRYHAVTTAAKLAALTDARLVLGSATPGLREVHLASEGKIGLVKLTQRANGIPPGNADIIDLRNKDNLRTSKFLSDVLVGALTETLVKQRQSLLFINRRGSASSHVCGDCGHVSACPNCHLPLTFHADHMQLLCHICNYHLTPGAVCTDCGSTNLRYIGGGTKRIESEIERLLPGARVVRIDKDSADPKALGQLYQDLHEGKVDILIGTQMIAKGLDLPRLDTIGVVSADTMLHMPDYTAAERTFALLAQVSGRTGRGDRMGRVIIQTYTPDHPAIIAAASLDFWGFAAAETEHRRLLAYPPFRHLLKLTYSHPDETAAKSEAAKQFAQIGSIAGVVALGPAPAFHERAGGQYHWQIIVKSAVRSRLTEIARSMPDTWRTDLDPVNLL